VLVSPDFALLDFRVMKAQGGFNQFFKIIVRSICFRMFTSAWTVVANFDNIFKYSPEIFG